MSMKRIAAVLGVFLILAVSGCTQQPAGIIDSFEDCIAAGNPVMESYPRQCRDPVSGQTFTEDIDDHLTEDIGDQNREHEDAGQEEEITNAGIPSCGDETEFFSYSPVALPDFMGLVPLGNLAPSGHVFPTDHMYFHINRVDEEQWDLGTIETDVIAPGDAWVTQIWETEYYDPPYNDYSVYFSPCSEVNAFFIHMTSLSDKLQQALDGHEGNLMCDDHEIAGERNTMCEKTGLNVKISAGEILGTAGGNDQANALDLGSWDLRNEPHEYANPARWGNRTLHIACPLDYFAPSAKDSLEAKLGSHDASSTRTIPPICGEVEQDEAGTAQGMWFVKGTQEGYIYTYPEDPHIALVHDNIDPSKAVFSVGTSVEGDGIPSGLYYFDPASEGLVNRDFQDITSDGSIYCFENLADKNGNEVAFTILLEMPSPTTLRIKGQDSSSCGSGPWSLIGGYTEFEK